MSDADVLAVDRAHGLRSRGCATSATSVLDGVSFEVRRPETVALVGESGSGKSVTALAHHGARRAGGADRRRARLLDGEDLLR